MPEGENEQIQKGWHDFNLASCSMNASSEIRHEVQCHVPPRSSPSLATR